MDILRSTSSYRPQASSGARVDSIFWLQTKFGLALDGETVRLDLGVGVVVRSPCVMQKGLRPSARF